MSSDVSRSQDIAADLAQITIIYAVGEMFGGGLAAEDHCPGLRPALRLRSDHNSGPESPQSSESS